MEKSSAPSPSDASMADASRKRSNSAVATAVESKAASEQWCIALELLALFLHRSAGGDNHTTTTLCFNGSSNVLYATTQGDPGVVFASLRAPQHPLNFLDQPKKSQAASVLGAVRAAAAAIVAAKQDAKQLSALIYGDESADATGTKKAKVSTALRYRKEADQLFAFGRERLDAIDVTHLDTLVARIGAVKLVHEREVFWQETTTEGMHGEARLARFLFIKYSRGTSLLLDPGKGEQAFYDHVATLSLHFGSSQGTCPECGALLDRMRAAHGEVRDKKATLWTHPITGLGRHRETIIREREGDGSRLLEPAHEAALARAALKAKTATPSSGATKK